MSSRRRGLGMTGRALFTEKPHTRKNQKAYKEAAKQRTAVKKIVNAKRNRNNVPKSMKPEAEAKSMRANHDGPDGGLSYQQAVREERGNLGVQNTTSNYSMVSARQQEYQLTTNGGSMHSAGQVSGFTNVYS